MVTTEQATVSTGGATVITAYAIVVTTTIMAVAIIYPIIVTKTVPITINFNHYVDCYIIARSITITTTGRFPFGSAPPVPPRHSYRSDFKITDPPDSDPSHHCPLWGCPFVFRGTWGS